MVLLTDMTISEMATYAITFLAVYIQVFFLITFIERRKELLSDKEEPKKLTHYPSLTVIMPCWNEETTVHGTIDSLLHLDYPKDKLKIIVVDDGSTDTTWEEISKYEGHPQIKIYHKENGGKHTALNLGLEKADTDFIACLDADSFVAPDALLRIMPYFDNPLTMSVAPAAVIHQPKTLVQSAQRIDYFMSAFIKKMLGLMSALHVTPGTLPVYRKEVFEKLGGFRKAYNTEDGEIALRMQANNMKIDYCPDAIVYTIGPNTVKKLFHQRVRWTYGFFRNLMDYRHLFFRKQFGNLAFFTLPAALLSMLSAVYLFGMALANITKYIVQKVIYYRTVGFTLHGGPHFTFDWFYLNTKTTFFIIIMLYLMVVLTMILGRRLVERKTAFSLHILTYMLLYSIVAPFWLLKSVYNVVRRKQISWR